MKIIIADDHALFRDGLRHILSRLDPAASIHEAANHEAAATLLAQHSDADLALVDLHMPGQQGAAAIETLLSANQTVPVVVLSASDDRRDMRHVLNAGAMGFIHKSETAEVMLSALRLVLSGGVYVPPALLTPGEAEPVANGPLTPRQREVLERVIEGKSNKEIGRDLGLSEATIKVHVSAIFKALNVTNRTQAARAAEAIGITVARG